MSDYARSHKPVARPAASKRPERVDQELGTNRIAPVPGLVVRRLITGVNDTSPGSGGSLRATNPGGLVVGRVDDPHERHADETADRVLAGVRRRRTVGGAGEIDTDGPSAVPALWPPVAALRRSAGAAAAGDTARSAGSSAVPALRPPVAAIRRSAAAIAPVVGAAGGRLDSDLSAEISRRRGSGAPLPEPVRAGLGELSGAASAVRIHDDADSDRLAKALSAKAFTVGNDVFFAGGEYRPDTEEGQHTLAHEVAHAAEGGTETHRIARKYNLQLGKPTGLMGTASARPFGPRTVWQLTDKSGDRIVVKMENQPLGLNDLATAVHKSVTKTDTVLTKPLEDFETKQVKGLLTDPRIATGDKWRDAAANTMGEVNGKTPADFNDPDAWGRWVTQYDKLTQTDPMIAMSIAPGKSAEALLDPALATQANAGTAPFRTVIERRDTATKLGELSAVDIFLGNDDRVMSGNLGNWFYNPDGSMTAIDNVNGTLTDNIDQVEHPDLPMLYSGNLDGTARALADSLKRRIKAEYGLYDKAGKQSVDDWFNASSDGTHSRYDNLVQWLTDGLIVGRKRVIKTFTSTRFTNTAYRGAKKALKKQARASAQTDNGVDYYSIMKQRAKMVSKDGAKLTGDS